MDPIELEIVTPTRKLVATRCKKVLLPGHNSQLEILPRHADLLSVLRAGLLRFELGLETRHLALRSGFVSVQNDKVLVLADEAVSKEEIDPSQLEREQAQVSEDLVSGNVSVAQREHLFERRDWLATQALLMIHG